MTMSFEGRYHIVTVNSAEMLVQMGFLRFRPWALVLERRERGLRVVTLEEIEREGWKV